VEQMKRLTWVWDLIAVAAPVVVTLVVAVVLWGACHAFGWELSYRQSLGVTAHAYLPSVLMSFALLVVLWNRATVDPQAFADTLYTNLGSLADPHKDSVVHGLLASVDLFSFWTMFLLVLGLSAATGARRGRMAVLVVSLWALFVLGKAGLTALTG